MYQSFSSLLFFLEKKINKKNEWNGICYTARQISFSHKSSQAFLFCKTQLTKCNCNVRDLAEKLREEFEVVAKQRDKAFILD